MTDSSADYRRPRPALWLLLLPTLFFAEWEALDFLPAAPDFRAADLDAVFLTVFLLTALCAAPAAFFAGDFLAAVFLLAAFGAGLECDLAAFFATGLATLAACLAAVLCAGLGADFAPGLAAD